MYKQVIRPILFKFSPETIHNFTIRMLSMQYFANVVRPFFQYENNDLSVKVGNLAFRNPIGLAAGMDKDCTALASWDAIGFGFAETGTVTPIPQDGNPKPRMFRYPELGAVINRMGFNNCGADSFLKNIIEGRDNLSQGFIVGVNIGKNKMTPIEEAWQDYKFCFEKLYEHADYFAINVSSPNTEGLRQLQQKKYLSGILKSLQDLNNELVKIHIFKARDIFLKIAPDLTEPELDDIIEASIDNHITGIIAANTTVSRDGLPENIHFEEGGLSGKPLRAQSNKIIGYIKKKAGEKLAVIASGGIFNADDVKEKLDLGAQLVQLYTGFVYEGPFVVKKIKKRLSTS
ncbi:MAG: quinone-dependent dihydroorotate dehydrogenase [Ignavibacteria bacterium]|jgi:dihydroorotate dehydrogenase